MIDLGFVIVPSLLLRGQRRLHITPTQLAVLMHLLDYWWDAGRKPFPAKKTLADRMGLGPRQVQRYIAELELAGLVTRVSRSNAIKGNMTNEYDLSGLVQRLRELEPEFKAAEETARAERHRVTRPGLRSRKEDAKRETKAD